MNALTLLVVFILSILFLESGHIEILIALLVILGLLPPEHVAALARKLGKMYYAVNKIMKEIASPAGSPLGAIEKVGRWRAERLRGERELKRVLEKVMKETKGS